LIEGPIPYDRHAYTELFLRAVQSLLMAVGVDRDMLDTWLLANAGYWGPPGILPPPGVDGRLPLLTKTRRAEDVPPTPVPESFLRVPVASSEFSSA
jgi:hypothetical protein